MLGKAKVNKTDVKNVINFVINKLFIFSFISKFFILNIKLKRKKLGISNVLKLDCSISTGSLLKSLITSVKLYNNLFFISSSSDKATLLIHLAKRFNDNDVSF